MSKDKDWEEFSAKVTPLTHRRQQPELPKIKLPKIINTRSIPTFSSRELPPLQVAEKSGVDRHSYENLRKGHMPVDAKLDLHGKSHAQAFRIFKQFILNAIMDGKRCLLIITGKGRPDTQSTLKNALPDWINHSEIRPFILTFTQASPKHGGSGAYTILLKRIRKE